MFILCFSGARAWSGCGIQQRQRHSPVCQVAYGATLPAPPRNSSEFPVAKAASDQPRPS